MAGIRASVSSHEYMFARKAGAASIAIDGEDLIILAEESGITPQNKPWQYSKILLP